MDVAPSVATLVGFAVTAVVVDLVVTVTVASGALELAACLLSDAVYDACIDGEPVVVDVKVTVHDDADEFSTDKVQLAPTLPGPPVVNDTVPPGDDAVPPA